MCARHIWSNWKQKWKREERRKKFWACARSSFEAYLKAKIDELTELGDSKIIEDLLRYLKQCWCRAFFKDWSKCDSVENNICETFNSWILSARHKSDCKTVGHNKKGCPILKGQGSGITGTSNAGATQPSQAAQTTTQQSGPTSDSGSARARNTQPSAVASASDTGSMRSRTSEDIIASVRGRPKGSGLRGRSRTTGFGKLFSDIGTVIDMCGARDRVHSAPTKVVDAGQTNIDLGYNAPGLRWQGRNAISQKQLQQ
uniref:Uncharacterized protein n=1 Tax=Nicotiana tabacum TaxID=4097 RepID=A0A1S4AMA4_TOBAC|nr:PREDICTED: uncharacterized protein LOC107799206 [Nicotiana tabacum]